MDDLFERPHRRHVADIPIVPILDMLVAVIFFLLISTSFVQLTQQSIPPARVSTITDPLKPPPMGPKLLVLRKGAEIRMHLVWEGLRPGHWSQSVANASPGEITPATRETAGRLVAGFKELFPGENTLQIGFNKQAAYQDVISVMDGARKAIQDVVLISNEDTESQATQIE